MKKLFWIAALAGALAVLVGGCDLFGSKDADTGDVTWSAVADAPNGLSTKITFTFSKEVNGLVAGDITIADGTGKATKGTGADLLKQSATDKKVWELKITPAKQGTVKVSITNKGGVDAQVREVSVFMGADYDVTANGSTTSPASMSVTTTELTLNFKEYLEAGAFTATNITITADTGKATVGTLTKSVGSNWTLAVTEVEAGNIKVKIDKDGITAAEKEVEVHQRLNTFTAEQVGGGATPPSATTAITFTFADAALGLTPALAAADIAFAPADAATKGALTKSATDPKVYTLAITSPKAGPASITITKGDISKAAVPVTLFDGKITWTAEADNKPADGAVATASSSKITFTFSAPVELDQTKITIGKDDDNGEITTTPSTLVATPTTTGASLKWELPISVTKEGHVKVKIAQAGIEDTEKPIPVYKAGAAAPIEPPEDGAVTFSVTLKPLSGSSTTAIATAVAVDSELEAVDGGYEYLMNEDYNASWVKFTVDLGTKKVKDYGKVSFKVKGAGADKGWKDISLLAGKPLPESLPANPHNGTYRVNTPPTTDCQYLGNKTDPTEGLFVLIDTAKASADLSGKVDFAFYPGSEKDTTWTITDIVFEEVAFEPVTNITLVSEVGYKDVELTLNPTVVPANATNKTIKWSEQSDKGTATYTITEAGVINATAAGTAKITATITNGLTASSNYTKDFTITINDEALTEHVINSPIPTDVQGDDADDVDATTAKVELNFAPNATVLIVYMVFPTNWADYTTVEVEYETTGIAAENQYFTLKNGAWGDVTPATYPTMKDGTDTWTWPITLFSDAGFSFQASASKPDISGSTFEIKKITLKP